MREFEFRACSPRWNKIIYQNDKDYEINVISGSVWSVLDAHEDENADIQQWTGLKDKNGKKIFEGDILKCLTHDERGDKFELVGDVRFEEFEYVIITNDDKWPCASFSVLPDKEIIGNIFENENLLTNPV